MSNVIRLFPEQPSQRCADCVHFAMTNGAVSLCWELLEPVNFDDGSDCGDFRWA